MVDSPEANANEPRTQEDEMMEEEFHDAATVQTGETPTLTGKEWQEQHILIEITYNNQTEARTSPQKHMMILKALGNAFDVTELEIYDNKNRKLSLAACRGMTNIEHYESHYKIHQGNGRHYVIFRVMATVGFQALKRQGDVLKTLKATGCYLKRHHWGPDKWDIVTLGFLIELDPGRHMADEVREQILELSKAKECNTPHGARFKLVAQRFKLKHNNNQCNADAFGVQCMRIDAQAVDKQLRETYKEANTYVKNKLRKENPRAYTNALRIQNKYMTKVKTVILVGITRNMMSEIRPLLLAHVNIDHVATTKKLDSIGRWDILTEDQHRKTVIDMIEEKLPQWIATMESTEETPNNFPTPGLQIRAENSREISSQGDVSYLSSSAGSYDSLMEHELTNYDGVPTQRQRHTISVEGFSWAEVTARTTTTPSQGQHSHVSEITTPTTVHATHNQEISALRTKVDGLTTQVENLVKLLTMQATAAAEAQATVHQPPQGYGYPRGLPPFPQYTHQWQGSPPFQPLHQPPVPPEYQMQQTPTRTNTKQGSKTTGLSPNIKRHQTMEAEPQAKRKDDKVTPTKTASVEPPPHPRDQLQFNPYHSHDHYSFATRVPHRSIHRITMPTRRDMRANQADRPIMTPTYTRNHSSHTPLFNTLNTHRREQLGILILQT